MKKKLVGLALVLLAVLMVIPSAFAASDLPKEHRFYEEITYLMDKGIITGYPDGTFRPSETLTRAQAAILISRLRGFEGTQQKTPFSDVPKGHAASGYIAAAAKAKLLSGYADGTFKPDAAVIRGDMAIILQRVFELGITMDSNFKDVSDNMKAAHPIETLIAANITIGYPDQTFRPNDKVTRGQFSAFLARGLEPEFKNDATIPHSYLRDKTKIYVIQGFGETVTYTFKKHAVAEGMPLEFMWVLKSSNGSGTNTAIVELENHSEYAVGFPYSESFVNLAYPVINGKEFISEYVDLDTVEKRKITGVQKTVKTPYKTFTDATEVTDSKGSKYYYAEGHGQIKLIDASGKVLSHLIDVR